MHFLYPKYRDAISEASNLWFEHEPALEEIYKAIDEFDFSDCNEVVFCGYGEPTMALENLIAVSKYIRKDTHSGSG